jgi:hypothetical protein
MRAAFTPIQMPIRSPLSYQPRKHEIELHGRTDETDDKPTLPSHSDLPYLRPQPTERYPTVRVREYTVLLRRIRLFLSMIESCIQSVKRTAREEGFSFETLTVSPGRRATYRREVFILAVSSRQGRSWLWRSILCSLDLRYILKPVWGWVICVMVNHRNRSE